MFWNYFPVGIVRYKKVMLSDFYQLLLKLSWVKLCLATWSVSHLFWQSIYESLKIFWNDFRILDRTAAVFSMVFCIKPFQSSVKCFPLRFFGISIYISTYNQVDFLEECLFFFFLSLFLGTVSFGFVNQPTHGVLWLVTQLLDKWGKMRWDWKKIWLLNAHIN